MKIKLLLIVMSGMMHDAGGLTSASPTWLSSCLQTGEALRICRLPLCDNEYVKENRDKEESIEKLRTGLASNFKLENS